MWGEQQLCDTVWHCLCDTGHKLCEWYLLCVLLLTFTSSLVARGVLQVLRWLQAQVLKRFNLPLNVEIPPDIQVVIGMEAQPMIHHVSENVGKKE